jgi:hypothetical protein
MAKEHLVKARELIANGWTQGDLWYEREGKICYCLDGAVAAAHGHEKPDWNNIAEPAVRADLKLLAQEVVPELTTIGYQYSVPEADYRAKEMVYLYNDNSTTTQEDVITFLDKVIENYPVKETGV